MDNFYQKCFEHYNDYLSAYRRFDKHAGMLKTIGRFKPYFKIKQVGTSVENREVLLLQAGNGSIKVLIWTQMHGDEDTATGAIFDILKFFATNDKLNTYRQNILNKLSIYIIPMLNPDGAEKWDRRNHLGIDLNRDALRQVSPESKILQKAFSEIKPQYCFNMHDQESYYAAGENKTPATISLLAPPADAGNTVSATRENAIGVVCSLHNMLQNYIPNGVGKWNDDFEPRAFGEHFQNLGASTILIESGGYYKDPDRRFARKLNFVSLLHVFYNLATNQTMNADLQQYNNIPLNNKGIFFDMILRNVLMNRKGYDFLCDIGLKVQSPQSVSLKVEEVGDLSPFCAFSEHDMGGIPLNEEILEKLQISGQLK